LQLGIAILDGTTEFSWRRSGLSEARAVLFAIAALAEKPSSGYPLQTLSRARLVWLGLLLNFVSSQSFNLGNPNVVPDLLSRTQRCRSLAGDCFHTNP
jgi:hypothetical protein